jgi:hypothetical protein
MRFSMSLGAREPAPSPLPPPGGLPAEQAAAAELRLLEAQLERMRGMLFGYSSLFFATIRNWAFLSIGLLVLGWSGALPAAVVPVPFIVPFAFLETGYLFWYTVFARRHAERLEQAINERLGHEVLAAHRLEAAYFYPPDAPKVAALSFGNPTGFMSAMTVGYSAGAGLLWLAGLVSTASYLEDQGVKLLDGSLGGLVVPLAVTWTAGITVYLAWAFLRRPDEERFLPVLRDAYRLPDRAVEAPPPADAPSSVDATPPAAAPPTADATASTAPGPAAAPSSADPPAEPPAEPPAAAKEDR